ncbi:uncharacterized protein LOC128547997 [Mercenaria mercenaria]|uniref:uncharacterized protein LOC128547997 n=1 Tax=Mercenaria mercenaria TaxID=6596 RepID=UPI00234E62C9|nr:uncharacterized protein LOC128547997 [Mercenaria mercenaria]
MRTMREHEMLPPLFQFLVFGATVNIVANLQVSTIRSRCLLVGMESDSEQPEARIPAVEEKDEISVEKLSDSDSDFSTTHSQSSALSVHSHAGTAPKKHSKSKSKYKTLEKKFNQLDEKLNRVLTQLDVNSATSKKSATRGRSLSLSENSDSEGQDSREDVLSLHSNSKFSDGEISDSNDDNLSGETKKCLFDIFGEDAKVKSKPKPQGLKLDDSQKEVLEANYRCNSPNLLTAFSEDTLDMFPIDESTETFLQVPPLDPFVENCLIKRHGNEAAFSKHKVKGLFTQPCKSVERIAYKGQHAARLGMVIQMYIQQSLGNLLELVQSEQFDKSSAVKQIKDVFAMSTKGLEQLGRTAALHHIIRRSLAMSDTALYDLSDANDFRNLPLRGDGVFGGDLDGLLKNRKEKKKQLEDLVPDIQRKRKFDMNMSSSSSVAKKGKYSHVGRSSSPKPASSWQPGNFRIPRVPQSNRYQSRQSSYSKGTTRDTFRSKPSSSGRGHGKTGRQ